MGLSPVVVSPFLAVSLATLYLFPDFVLGCSSPMLSRPPLPCQLPSSALPSFGKPSLATESVGIRASQVPIALRCDSLP